MLRADGRAVWIRDLVSFATGLDGRDLLRGVMLDITEGREADEAFEAPHLATARDRGGGADANPAFERALLKPRSLGARTPATRGDRVSCNPKGRLPWSFQPR